MSPKVREIAPKKESQELPLDSLSVIELKALVYDRIGVIEQLQFKIKQEQEAIAQINAVIQKKENG